VFVPVALGEMTTGTQLSVKEERGGGYRFGRVAVLGRGLLFGLDQNGSLRPFNLFLFSIFFSLFLFCFYYYFAKTTPNQILKPLLKLSNFSLCLVNFRETFEIERQTKLK
jgi:hypothetical protein